MKISVQKTDEFLCQFKDQIRWYEETAGAETAWLFYESVERRMEDIARQPGMGRVWRARFTDLTEVRSFPLPAPFTRFLFYRLAGEAVQIIALKEGHSLDAALRRAIFAEMAEAMIASRRKKPHDSPVKPARIRA